ncbi:MAG: hypothetical protein IZT57_05350, partial [Chloroflexi bacterium]|nr:hypothetical protein [Chloroflexota bacterium]
SAIDVAFNAFITALPSAYVYTQLASRAMLASNIVIRLGLEPEIVEKLTRHKLTEVTAPLAQAVKTRIAGETSSIRPRVLLKKSCTERAVRLRAGTHKPDDLDYVKSQLLLIKPDVIIKAMGEALTLEGYD